MDFYWELIQHDGTRLEIPPEAVETIKRRMNDGLPINTRTMTIPTNQIKFFRITDKPYSAQPLLEEVSGVFNEPMLNEDGDIICRWVKKTVTQAKWDKYYAPHGYKRLGDDGGMVVIAMRLPVHQINQAITPYCNEMEVAQLERY